MQNKGNLTVFEEQCIPDAAKNDKAKITTFRCIFNCLYRDRRKIITHVLNIRTNK